MVTLLAYIFIAVMISFFCTLFKTVLVNISPGSLSELETSNAQYATAARQLYDDLDSPLAVLSFIKTIALTLGAIAAGIIATHLAGQPVYLLSGFVVFVVLLTIALPKMLGAFFYEALVSLSVTSVNLLMKPVRPLLAILERLPYSEKRPARLRDEMKAMADLGEEAGVLHGDESDLVKNMLRFRDLRIVEIMTPRSVLFTLPEEMSTAEYMQKHPDNGFSRIPVYSEDDPDDINGFVMKTDILMAHSREGSDTPLREVMRPLMAVLENEPLPKLMGTLLEKRCHIAMVVTEYGDIRGIVTLEDMIETLLGREIVDENDEAVDMQQKARDKWAHRLPARGC